MSVETRGQSRREYQKAYWLKHKASRRQYFQDYRREWRKKNPVKVISYGLKRLSSHPEVPLWREMSSIDSYTGYEANFIDQNQLTPFEEVCLREENI